MNKSYKKLLPGWLGGMLLLLAGLAGGGARAQSGPVGNEWIVPTQQYYKVKVLKDGLYKLDYQYLTQAGIGGVAPSQLQVWRRGREVAAYGGGNQAVLDPSTFLEFYAVHNDARLDVELYKQPQDQPHPYYSFYTDTAAYFITWSASGRAGRRMAQPAAAGGAVHPHRLASQLNQQLITIAGRRDMRYFDFPVNQYNYLPWVEPGEGFFVPSPVTAECDSVVRSLAPTGPAPQVEVLVFGASVNVHAAEVLVTPPGGAPRSLGVIRWTGRTRARQSFALLRSDVSSSGRVTITARQDASSIAGDYFFVSYFRLQTPQVSRWFANRRSVAFANDSTLAGPATYEFAADSIPATAVGFDVEDLYNVQRVVATVGSGGSRRFVFPGATAAATHDLLLADEAAPVRPPLPARRVRFRAINPAAATFIIITHPQLMTGPVNAAREYAIYRASTAGGRYDTLLVTAPQLYDQFQYGDRSWLALRHFARWTAAASPAGSNRYLLLLGKAIGPSETVIDGSNFGNTYAYTTARGAGERGLDLVPVSSRSGSDNLLTADFANNDFAARLNTGRLTATTPAQVLAYLDKVKEHDRLGDEPWRKNVLHLVGGHDVGEFAEFRGYMNKYKQRAEQPLLGARVTTIERTVPLAIAPVVSQNIAPQLNSGLSLITFFGHGSNTSFSLNIGYVSDAGLGYNNPGRYPVLIYNNCAAGNTFVRYPTFFEDWLFAPNKGAVGGMGQYGLGFASYLDPAQDTLYKLLFNDPRWYGKPVTAVYNEAVRRMQLAPNYPTYNPFNPINQDGIASEQLLCTMWHGDPTIALYAPPKPDFQVSNASLSIVPVAPATSVTANSSEFVLRIAVANPLKVTTDPVEIRVTRIFDPTTLPVLPNAVFTQTFPQGQFGSATYDFRLPNPAGANVFGTNTFRVEVDYLNKVDEASETNNTAQTTFTFLRGGLRVLNPVEFAIAGSARPRLVAQTNDPNGPARGYEFEADTAAAFNSPLKQASGPVTATLTPGWQPTLPGTGRDSTVWYWRVRFQAPAADEDASWVGSSFRLIAGRLAGGWSQSHPAQFRRDQRIGVDVAAPGGQWAFSTENQALLLSTLGGGLPGAASTFNTGTGVGIITNPNQPPAVMSAACGNRAPNVLVAVYDQRTLKPKTNLPGGAVCGAAPQLFYTFGANPAANTPGDTLNTLNNNATRQAQLTTFLANVPEGDYVAVISLNRLRWPSLPTVRAAFSTLLGSTLINQLQNGDPFAIVAQKRTAGGRLLSERGPNPALPTPRHSQVISLNDTLRTPSSRGVITSTRIGPAKSWENLYHWVQRAPGATSSYALRLIGTDTLGRTVVLNPAVPAGTGRAGLPLAGVSAALYPYLQLELTLQDSVSRVAPRLRQWLITYQGVPEGVVRRDLVAASEYDPARLLQQATTPPGTISFPVSFENVTPYAFGTPLRARVEVRDATGIRASATVVAPPLAGDATVTIPVSVSLVGKFGVFTTKVTVNPAPRPLPELNLFNNELTLAPFTVIDRNVPPTLDVAIDGRHILNGELVSSQPVIRIQLTDEDRLRVITDRSVFSVTLVRPGAGAPVPVNLSGPDVDFKLDVTQGSVATLTYEPGKAASLPDGMYTLRVQGRDPSNAAAGSQEFQVKFEVVSASSISNVYPYPNPVVNKARFVFTLTGHQLPDNMKIQILSLAGRVVKEIFMSELGPLHIGNNLTEYAWDGTDTYGDRLANGTYLYRVALNDPTGQFARRETAGDKAFKNDWGKLVLMR